MNNFSEKNIIIGNRISALRYDSTPHVTQRDLAQAINVDRSKISRIESGERPATIEEIMNIADYFNISVYYIIGLTDCRQSNMQFIKNTELADKTALDSEYELSLKAIQPMINVFRNISDNISPDSRDKLINLFYNSIKKK